MGKNNSNIDFGKYNLNKMLRNPMIIHRIQDNLLVLDQMELLMNGGIIGAAIVSYSKISPSAVVKILAKENREKVTSLIGIDTMKLIDEYMEGETDSPDDLPENLFTQPKNS